MDGTIIVCDMYVFGKLDFRFMQVISYQGKQVTGTHIFIAMLNTE